MIRYPAFDPPEYLHWQAEPAVVEEYAQTISRDPRRLEIIQGLGSEKLLSLYEGMVRNRLHDIALKRWVKQGVISKAWLGTGEEAATIGPVHALNRATYPDGLATDVVAPMIRNAGACHEMGMPVVDMLRGYLGTEDSPTRGRDLHIGDMTHGVLAPISHVGDIMAVTGGIALSFKLQEQPRVAMTWIGDGSTKNGVFHEAMNFSAVLNLPLVVIIQNNQVALGTRLDQHHRSSFAEWHQAYGITGSVFDGNNVLDAYAAARIAVDECRSGGGPVLLVAETFRMGGHATHDEREARATFDASLFEHWGRRDPIGLYESFLIEGSIDLGTGNRSDEASSRRQRNEQTLREIEGRILLEIDRATEAALESRRSRNPRPESAGDGVYEADGIVTDRKMSAAIGE